MKEENQREYYRLSYPDSRRPSLVMDVENYEIADVSEYGMKVKIDNDPPFMVADSIIATIAFPYGKEFDLSGEIVRIDEDCAGLKLETPLPLSVIREESLFLMNNYSMKN